MPWRGPEVPGEFPTLGYQVADWIEARCAIPDRDQVGDPFTLTDEQLRFLLWFYRVNPEAKYDKSRQVWRGVFHFARGGQLCRPQGWGKGPFSGAITCAEAAGPVVFDGWDANGEPVGRAWSTPIIQITALSEDQTDNVWMSLLPMVQLGNFEADIPETGKLRIYLPGGGMIEPVTSSARSRLGQRVTFLVQDQTESWTQTNGGRALADNQRRNISKMGGRWISTCNAWDPTEESVAQYTAETEVDQGNVYDDDVEPPEGLSIRNKTERRKALKHVYGDAWWVDLDRVDDEIRALVRRDAAQAERFFLNRKRAMEAKAFNGERWDISARPDYVVEQRQRKLIVIGVDGAQSGDDLAVVGTEVETGFQWLIGLWSRPEGAPEDYRHPLEEVDGVVKEAVDELYDVWRIYIDPGSYTGNIMPLVEKWMGRWGHDTVFAWAMNRQLAPGIAVNHYAEAIAAGQVWHSGDERFTRQIKNAVRQKISARDENNPALQLYKITKERPDSPLKIDAAAAAVLAWEARSDALKDDATRSPSTEIKYSDQRDKATEENEIKRPGLILRGDRYIDADRVREPVRGR